MLELHEISLKRIVKAIFEINEIRNLDTVTVTRWIPRLAT